MPVYRHWLFLRALVGVAFVLFVVLLGPWWSVYEFNSDEGINLQKAVLLAAGYNLYTDIWNDQPPFLTWVLAFVQAIEPFYLPIMRLSILCFSVLLVTSFFGLVRRFHGDLAAWIAVVLLISIAPFLKLSVSVMIGLPAIALAMAALDLAAHARGRAQITVAGAVFAVALMTKLFVAVMLPSLLLTVWLIAHQRPDSREKVARFQLWWVLVGLAVVLGTSLFFVPVDALVSQLISPHLTARVGEDFSGFGGPDRLYALTIQPYSALIWSIPIFIVTIFFFMTRIMIIPLLWLMIGVLVLATHQPLSFHHVLLITPPFVWICAAGLSTLFQVMRKGRPEGRFSWIRARWLRIVAGGTIAASGVGIVTGGIDEIDAVRRTFAEPAPLAADIAQLSLRLFTADDVDTLITDKPIDAFYARKMVPVNLAVFSMKRLGTGNLTNADVAKAVMEHPKANILFRRFPERLGPLVKPEKPFQRIGQTVDRYTNNGFVGYVRSEPLSPLESALIGALRSLTDITLGGVGAPNLPARYDRPNEKMLEARAVVTRPRGSAQEMGACLLAAAEATDSRLLLFESVEVAAALQAVQKPSGGWSHWAVPNKPPASTSFGIESFDDGTLTSIVLFAYELADAVKRRNLPDMAWLDEMIDRALLFVKASQMENGAWPLSLSNTGYSPLATLNDDTTTGLIRVLLRAYKRTGEKSYLETARRGGDFLLNVQRKGPQAGFAQQYSPSLSPAPARKFEPAAYASLETGYAINALVDLYRATGDPKYRLAAEEAAKWLQERQLGPDLWARFYNVEDGAPLYANRQGDITSTLDDLSESERARYRFTGGRAVFPQIGEALDRIAALGKGKEELAKYDKMTAASALLSETPTARIPLDSSAADRLPQPGDTRAFAEWCGGLVAREIALRGR